MAIKRDYLNEIKDIILNQDIPNILLEIENLSKLDNLTLADVATMYYNKKIRLEKREACVQKIKQTLKRFLLH